MVSLLTSFLDSANKLSRALIRLLLTPHSCRPLRHTLALDSDIEARYTTSPRSQLRTLAPPSLNPSYSQMISFLRNGIPGPLRLVTWLGRGGKSLIMLNEIKLQSSSSSFFRLIWLSLIPYLPYLDWTAKEGDIQNFSPLQHFSNQVRSSLLSMNRYVLTEYHPEIAMFSYIWGGDPDFAPYFLNISKSFLIILKKVVCYLFLYYSRN